VTAGRGGLYSREREKSRGIKGGLKNLKEMPFGRREEKNLTAVPAGQRKERYISWRKKKGDKPLERVGQMIEGKRSF